MNEFIQVTEILRNIVLALVAIAAFERGKKALDDNLALKRGNDRYNLGKSLLRTMFSLVEAIHRLRGFGYADERINTIRDLLSELKIKKTEAIILGVDFSDEVDSFSLVLFELAYSQGQKLDAKRKGKPMKGKDKSILVGHSEDQYGQHIEKLAQRILVKVQEEMFKASLN